MDNQPYQSQPPQLPMTSESGFDESPKSKNTRLYFLIAIIVLIGAAVYGGMRLLTLCHSGWFTISRCGVQNISNTASWQTYRNEKLGFEIKLLPDWSLETDEAVDSKSALGAVHVCKKGCVADQLNLDWNLEIVRSLGGSSDSNPGSNWNPIIIGDKQWYQEINLEGTYLYKVERYAFFVSGRDIDRSLLQQILSTFKFIEPVVCIQVITPARNPQTGEVIDFPTPCDVPEGWVKI